MGSFATSFSHAENHPSIVDFLQPSDLAASINRGFTNLSVSLLRTLGGKNHSKRKDGQNRTNGPSLSYRGA